MLAQPVSNNRQREASKVGAAAGMASDGFLRVNAEQEDESGEDEGDGDHAAQPTKPGARGVN